jgi:autoinducer 2 (AI-2) kinase
MREGIVLYDKDKNELWGVANVDSRASDEVRYLKENFTGAQERFYAASGQTFALGALPRLLWLQKQRPQIYEKVAYVSMIGEWMLAKLSGEIASEPSNSGTSGIFSLKNRTWASEMAKEVGLNEHIFPPCYESGTVIGTVKVSSGCGLSTKTKVVLGGGDVGLGSLGLGVVDVGEVAVLGGSFWQQVVNIKSDTELPLDMNIRVNPHVIDGLAQAEGITFFSGLVMRWFRDVFCELEKLEAQKLGIDVYELLESKAKGVPVGSYGIVPIFSDSMKYAKWYHASPSFINLSLDASKCNKASMFRALQENAAIVSAINLNKIKEFAGVEFDTIVFAAGASKGALWCQILSDVTGCQVKVPVVKEATALGVCICAGVGAGIFDDLASTAKRLVQWERVYEPNMQNHKLYGEIKERWSAIYDEQLKLVDAGLTESMWRAAGV